MERPALKAVHEATEVLVSANVEDPVYVFCYPGGRMRRIFLYTLFYPQMVISRRCCRVMKNADGQIVCTVIFDDDRMKPLLQFLSALSMSLLMFYALLKKVALEFFHSWNVLTAIGALGVCILLAPLSLLFWLRFFLFFTGFLRGSMAGYFYMRKGGWHKKRMKHLLAIGTLASEQGKGGGGALMRAAIEELDADGYYGGYYLESSNPRNVPFYERNHFTSLGSTSIFGCVITNLVRPAKEVAPAPK